MASIGLRSTLREGGVAGPSRYRHLLPQPAEMAASYEGALKPIVGAAPKRSVTVFNEETAPAGPRPRATDDVIDRLSRLITGNQMEAGNVLPSEQALSEMFGVSKRTVREGLRALAAQGVVRTAQGKRAVVSGASPVAIEAYFRFVQRMDGDSVAELYELREVIEVGASALAARRATAKDMARARHAIDSMTAAGDNADDYIAGDLAFHSALIDSAHNRFLTAVMSALSGALHVERELGVRSRIEAGGYPRAVAEHRAVLEAIEARDSSGAERAMVAHMASGRADLVRYVPKVALLEAKGRGGGSQRLGRNGDNPKGRRGRPGDKRASSTPDGRS